MKKLELPPGGLRAVPPDEDTDVVVLIRLHPDAEFPDFLTARAQIAPGLFSAEVKLRDLERIEHDPAVSSMAMSRGMPMID